MHKKTVVILIFLISQPFLLASTQTDITIFVHGSRRLSRLFLQYTNQENKIVKIKNIPASFITHSICDSLSGSDSLQFPKEHFYVFGWSGKINNPARLDAAHILYDEIVTLIKKLKKQNINPRINLITHSHGGNVALNLAHCIDNNELKFNIYNLILLACPVQEQTCALINHALFTNVYNIYSTLDLTQILDPQGMHAENKHKKVPFFSQRTFDVCPKLKQAKIKINKYGITHAGFLSSKFFKRLPNLLKCLEHLPAYAVHSVKI